MKKCIEWVLICLVFAAGLSACGQSAATNSNGGTLTSITLTPLAPSVSANGNLQFTATGTYSSGPSQDITSLVIWSSSDTGIATVNASGLATGIAVGAVTITATSGSISGSKSLTVTALTLTSIAVTPATPSIAAAVTQQFIATGTYSDGTHQNITASVVWTSSDTSVATINTGGLATGQAAGTVTITATSGVSGTATLTVTPATLVTIAVTPATPSIAAGVTKQFVATGTYSDSATYDITASSSTVWTSSDPTIATINPSSGLATGQAVGTVTITATSGAVSGTATLTVTTLVSISVTPTNPSITIGASQPFTATGTYSNGSTQDLTLMVTWNSSNPGVATITNTGFATALAAVSTKITASFGTIVSAPAILTVTSSVSSTTDVAGYWGGTWASSNRVATGTLYATIAQTGATFSGNILFTGSPCFTNYSNDTITGGIVSGNTVSWNSPGFGNFSGTVSGSAINGIYSVSEPGACFGDSGTFSVTRQIPNAPNAPTGVFASAGNGQNIISWNTVTGATTYNLYWSTTSGVTTTGGTKITNVTSPFTHSPLTNATTYYYVITAENIGGESAASLQVSATPHVPPAPQAPVGVTASAGWAENIISWNTVTVATTYNLYSSTTSGVTIQNGTKIPGVSSPYSWIGVTSGVTYYYIVTAVNIYGESTASAEVSVVAGKLQVGGAIQGNPLSLATSVTATVTTLAGTGVTGYVNGTGTSASFNNPYGITTDGTNLYVADQFNDAIRKIVISTGSVTTLAGPLTGVAGYINGTGTSARFHNPHGITTDGTNLYVADMSNHAIRKIVISTGVVTTLAGSGACGSVNGTGTAASFCNPYGITTDGTNLYVADTNNHAIRKIVISTGVVTTLAGSLTSAAGYINGTGTSASFNEPMGITTDGTNLYVADTVNHAIREIIISSVTVTTLAGTGAAGYTNGPGVSASFYDPGGITTDGTNLYVADARINAIRMIVISTGDVTTLAGSLTGVTGYINGTDTSARFSCPEGITTDGTSLYVADMSNHAIRKIR